MLPGLVVGSSSRLLGLLPILAVCAVVVVAVTTSAATPTIISPSLSAVVAVPASSAAALIVPFAAIEPIVAVTSSSLVVRARVTIATDFNVVVLLLFLEGHCGLDLFDGALGFRADFLPLALQARVVLLF